MNLSETSLPGTSLQHIRSAAIAALNSARGDLAVMCDVVNWDRINVTSVERYENDAGIRGIRVWLVGASPEATRLKDFIANALSDYDVEIVITWT